MRRPDSQAVGRAMPSHVRTLGADTDVLSVAFDDSGQILASAGSGATVRLWEPETGRLIRILEGRALFINALAFDRDGDTLSISSDDGAINRWDVARGT